jgi:uncharacterized protein
MSAKAAPGEALAAILVEMSRARPLAVAVSGGVDSLTLMAFAHDVVAESEHGRVVAAHAISPAVPPAATARVEEMARARGWRLVSFDAGETSDPAYLANPVDRCRVCKTHLYDAVSTTFTGTQVLSGTNTDDLGDYRPGLLAAKQKGVRHPFVEAGMDKAAVRALARHLGLHDVAELPAQPCLSSRIETGVRIEAPLLSLVNAVEEGVRARLGPSTVVRCRVRRAGVVVELDARLLSSLDERSREGLVALALDEVKRAGLAHDVTLAPYKMGSAFLHVL